MTINGIAAGMRNTGWLQIINGSFRVVILKVIHPIFVICQLFVELLLSCYF
jgi:hypothetical protein